MTVVASQTPDLVTLTPMAGVRMLTDAQLATLKAATLTVLEEVGVHVPSARARTLLGDHGARVAADGVVRFPPDLVGDHHAAAAGAAPRRPGDSRRRRAALTARTKGAET